MLGRLFIPILIAAFLVLLAVSASAENLAPQCMPLIKFQDKWADEFHEYLADSEMADGRLYLLFGSRQRTWTIAWVRPKIWYACTVAYGTNWKGFEKAFYPVGYPL